MKHFLEYEFDLTFFKVQSIDIYIYFSSLPKFIYRIVNQVIWKVKETKSSIYEFRGKVNS